jgi:hypothetical protein
MQNIFRAGARATLFAVLAAAPFAAAAQNTVKVGNATKRTSGTVTKLENGDISCSMTLKDDSGKTFYESADFEICSQKPSLVGKRVALTYKMARVQAASCQGDPDCKKSDTIALVTSAKVIANAGGASADAKAAPPANTAGGGQKSFCTPMETVVFACRTGAKLVSACASKDAAPGKGYLQYRFGKPDSAEPLEMVLPESLLAPGKVASGDTLAFSGGGAAWLRFRNKDTSYVMYTGIGNWGPKGEKREKQGVVVERGGKQIANVKCTTAPLSELGPDWFSKAGIKGDKDGFDMP